MNVRIGSKGGRVKAGRTVREQAAMWDFIQGLSGDGPLPKCETCGGILKSHEKGAPLRAVCACGASV